MKTDPIKMTFKDGFKGEMTTPLGTFPIGKAEQKLMPYHMLYGALGACFYATFLSVADKMRLTFSDVSIDITGTKREDIPTTLDHVQIDMVIFEPSHEEKLLKAAQNGAKYCSIHETVSQVAKIDLNVTFEYRT